MAVRVIASLIAVMGAAAMTLATMVALVRGTILAVSIGGLPLRAFAVVADFVIGTVLLLGCIYLATHLAVVILGVGRAPFPPLPKDESPSETHPADSPKI